MSSVPFWDICKHCRPWSDAAFWSGSTLFRYMHFYENNIRNEKKYSKHPINEKWNRPINNDDRKVKCAAPSEFGTYRLCEQRRFRRACASAQSHQNLRYSLKQAVSQEEPSDRKPDPRPLWMAGHAQLKLVMTECSKTQIYGALDAAQIVIQFNTRKDTITLEH